MDHKAEDATGSSCILVDIDKTIGERIRFRRQVLGWSQDELAQLCGISPQQIHKYEKGYSGLRPRRLIRFAEVLGVPVSWFFKGLEKHTKMPPDIVSILANPQVAELVRGFQTIEDENVQHGIIEMIRGVNRGRSAPVQIAGQNANRA